VRHPEARRNGRYALAQQFAERLGERFGALARGPIWPVLVMMPLAFFLMMLEMGRLVWNDMRGPRDDAPSSDNDNVSAAF